MFDDDAAAQRAVVDEELTNKAACLIADVSPAQHPPQIQQAAPTTG